MNNTEDFGQAVPQKEFLSTKEAASFLGVSIHQLYKYSSNNIIPFYKPQNKILYFRRTELIDFIIAGRVKTQAEIEQEADEYINKQQYPKSLK